MSHYKVPNHIKEFTSFSNLVYITLFAPSFPGKKKSEGCRDIRNFIGFKGKGNCLGEVPSQPSTSKNRQNDFPEKNVPEQGLKEKIDNGGQQSLSDTSAKQKNIQRLNGSSGSKVSQIKVVGASHSNVHGFGSQPPPQKKPCNGNGVAAGKTSGGRNMIKNLGGSGMTGLAVRGGGSRTVTVKGKTSTHSKTDTKENNPEEKTNSSHIAFQGQGYSLGSSNSKVSKLLSLSVYSHRPSSASLESSKSQQDDRLRSHESQTTGNTPQMTHKSLDYHVVTLSPSQSDGKTTRCPVCDASVPEKDINKHLDACVGNLSDDEPGSNDLKDEAQDTSVCEILPSASNEGLYFLGSNGSNVNSGREISEASSSQCHIGEVGELYPCPVCGECCSPATINSHLDTHF